MHEISTISQHDFQPKVWGEGIAKSQSHWFWLTYTERVVYKYDLDFNLVEELPLPSEMDQGWGLTSDDTWLYATDGSEKIYKIDPEDFTVVDAIPVYVENKEGKHPCLMINEIQMVDGQIYANVLTYNYIIRIDPSTGVVTRQYNMQ